MQDLIVDPRFVFEDEMELRLAVLLPTERFTWWARRAIGWRFSLNSAGIRFGC